MRCRISRAAVQRHARLGPIASLWTWPGYREKRSAALKRFSTQIAEEVIASGQEKALEAMSPADRKAVHDPSMRSKELPPDQG